MSFLPKFCATKEKLSKLLGEKWNGQVQKATERNGKCFHGT
jgi:hypothetical protein